MKSNLVVALLVVAAISVIGVMGYQSLGKKDRVETLSEANGISATLYKSPSCGCCGEYTAYLDGEGYEVDVKLEQDMSAVKEQFSIPYELESCHTMEVDGYVVEGHVPEAAIEKLLTERPDIKGIGMGGMPSGSPGMPGPKNGEFVIYEINKDGTKGAVFTTI